MHEHRGDLLDCLHALDELADQGRHIAEMRIALLIALGFLRMRAERHHHVIIVMPLMLVAIGSVFLGERLRLLALKGECLVLLVILRLLRRRRVMMRDDLIDHLIGRGVWQLQNISIVEVGEFHAAAP